MSVNEFELRERYVEQRAALARRMVKVGLVAALGLIGLCSIVAAPAVFLTASDAAPGLILPLVVVSLVVPLTGMLLLAGAMFKLVPMVIRYRQARRQDEDMFP